MAGTYGVNKLQVAYNQMKGKKRKKGKKNALAKRKGY
tara:strand:- start:65 stop:175 length:111 start_codon:yes stop_codon:yes gene_type:complete